MIINGDCLEEMRKMPDNSISCIVTDPPYGLSFMGKGWDRAVPGAEYWKECLRVTRPGGFLLAMGGTRTVHRLTTAIEDAGYEIRDSLMWIYGSGFPKSHNDLGLEGYGTALKPAHEPIIMAMKKCDGTFKQNAEKWGQAGINVDGCRIPTEENTGRPKGPDGNCYGHYEQITTSTHPKGRWPANVIFDEEAANVLGQPSRFFYCAKASSGERNEGLEGLTEKIANPNFGSCGYSRPTDQPERETKPSKNHHPTVKPIKLMEYLIKLVMPPKDGILLDPFAGSGTTILAAHRLGMKAIGIEKSLEYCEIANARISHFQEEKSLPITDR